MTLYLSPSSETPPARILLPAAKIWKIAGDFQSRTARRFLLSTFRCAAAIALRVQGAFFPGKPARFLRYGL